MARLLTLHLAYNMFWSKTDRRAEEQNPDLTAQCKIWHVMGKTLWLSNHLQFSREIGLCTTPTPESVSSHNIRLIVMASYLIFQPSNPRKPSSKSVSESQQRTGTIVEAFQQHPLSDFLAHTFFLLTSGSLFPPLQRCEAPRRAADPPTTASYVIPQPGFLDTVKGALMTIK